MEGRLETDSTHPREPAPRAPYGIAQARRAGGAVEGFALECDTGLVFTVKGLVHPPDRTVAYLRYVPDARGERRRGDVRYRRVYAFADMVEALEQSADGEYFTDDPVFGMRLQAVPDTRVRCVHDPRRRLNELSERSSRDPLETDALEIARLVSAAAGVSLGDLGISGSLLFGLHAPDSDVDVVVYGDAVCRAVHGALGCLLADPESDLRPHAPEDLVAIAAAHGADTPMADADFSRLQARKVNECAFGRRQVFFRFVKRPGEAAERYGDVRYEPLGRAVIRARVLDAREAMFTPCGYAVGDVTVEDGPAERPDTVVSFRGRFADQAREGEWVTARGTVERVTPAHGPSTARLTVGAPGDLLVSDPA